MPRLLRGSVALRLLVLAVAVLLVRCATAQTVWSGLTFSFAKLNGTDGSLPANQDFITPNAIFARGGTGALYNAATEPNYLDGTSPEFTEWATSINNEGSTIAASNYAALVFADFTTAYAHGIGNLILSNPDAVVHLIPEDIYFDIHFTSWATGHESSQPGFAYTRSQPPGPTGDYNGNHVVDAADYTLWRDTLGQFVSPDGSGADGNKSGRIDNGDYDFWKLHFGEPAPGGGSATAIPEPTLTAVFWGFLLFSGTIPRLRERKAT